MSAAPSVQGSTPLEAHDVDTGPTAAENAIGPDGGAGKKRKRKTLACYDCRRRKLKCDRIYPACGRCIRAGNADQCHYETIPDQAQDDSSGSEEGCKPTEDRLRNTMLAWAPKALQGTTRKPPQSDSQPSLTSLLRGGKFEQLEERIARLESLSRISSPQETGRSTTVAYNRLPVPLAGPRADSPQDAGQTDVEMMYFKGKSFYTQYYGASNPTSIISQFPELRAFMKAAIRQCSSLARVQSDLKLLNETLKIPPPVYTTSLDRAMLNLVPSREVADQLVKVYLGTIECLYRVLHVPSFYAEYNHFWDSPQAARPSFVALLLLIMSTVTGLASNTPKVFIGRSSQTRETSVRWIQTVEDWFATQSRKHVQIENFQVLLLIAIAKHMNIIKKKRAWEVASNVLKMYMSAGMHREPSILGRKIKFFDQEMRRRLWMSAVEWDLQASVSRGMPSSVAAYPYDCIAPMNLDDRMFNDTDVNSPKPKPPAELSDTSFLHIGSRSLRLRIQLTSLVNDPTVHVAYEDVLKFEEKIKEELDAVPSWEANVSDPQHYNISALSSVLLDVQLRQFLVWLHFPYASKTGSDSKSNYSRTACFNNATSILNLHASAMEKDMFALCLLRSDGYLAALTLCHNVYSSSLNKNNPILQTLTSSFQPAIQTALSIQEEKIMRLGEGRNHYWFISAASCFVQAKLDPDSASAAKHKAVEQVTRLFYKMLENQEDFNATSQATLSLSTGAAQRVEDLVPQNPKDLGQPQSQQLMTSSSAGSDFDPFQHLDPSEWALDNLWPIETMDTLDFSGITSGINK